MSFSVKTALGETLSLAEAMLSQAAGLAAVCLSGSVFVLSCAPARGAHEPEKATQVEAEAGSESTQLAPHKEDPGAALPARLCKADSPNCRALLEVEALIDEGELAKAEARLGELGASEGLRPARLVLEGRLLLETGSLTYGEGNDAARGALVLFDEALVADSGFFPAKLQKSRALLALGKGEDALALLEQLASDNEKDPEVFAALGIAYLSLGKTMESLGPLRRAAKLDPKEPERLIVLGTAYLMAGDLNQAEEKYRAALLLDQRSARAQGDLGALLLVQGKVKEGQERLLRAHHLAPTRATYVANLSYASLLLGDAAAALRQAREALKLDPELASAWLNQGLAEASLGQFEAARASFEKAHALDPSDPRPNDNLEELRELMKANAAKN